MTGATPGTVRHWLKNGLQPVAGCYPTIVRGVDLIDFLNRRNTSRKRPCGPGRLFCLRCKEPKRPAFDEVEFWQDGPKLGSLQGALSDLHRRHAPADLGGPHQGRGRRFAHFNPVRRSRA